MIGKGAPSLLHTQGGGPWQKPSPLITATGNRNHRYEVTSRVSCLCHSAVAERRVGSLSSIYRVIRANYRVMDRESCGRWIPSSPTGTWVNTGNAFGIGFSGTDKSLVKFWYRDKSRTLMCLGVVSTASTQSIPVLVFINFFVFF
jgi:hypothetical protein